MGFPGLVWAFSGPLGLLWAFFGALLGLAWAFFGAFLGARLGKPKQAKASQSKPKATG